MTRSALRLIGLLLALLAAAPPPKLAVGEPFPALTADAVRGPAVQLPTDRHGEPFIVLFAFSRSAGDAMPQWAVALHRALPATVPIYAVADLSRVPRFVRGFAIAAIRREAAPANGPGSLLLLTSANPWSTLVPSGPDDDVAAIAVDAAGSVTGVGRGPFSDDQARRLAASIASAAQR